MSLNWQPTGEIRIVEVPEGEAPRWVREAWLGLLLPCYPILGLPDGICEHLEEYHDGVQRPRGVLSSQAVDKVECGVKVPQLEALELLESRNPDAAAWWHKAGFPKSDPDENCFFFTEDAVEIVAGVTRQTVIEVTDEMMGDPNR